jgi:hypothetical protein
VTDPRLAGFLTASVGIFLILAGYALSNDNQTGALGRTVGGAMLILGTACAVSGVWALSGGPT